MNLERVKQLITEKHGDTVKIVDESFIGFKKKARFIDVEFGEWEAFVYAVCRGSRHKQRFLSEKRLTLEECQKRLQQKHCGRVSIKEDTWTKSSSKCTFSDVDFGEWEAYFCNVMSGLGHPDRVKQKRSESQKLSQEEIQAKLDTFHKGKVKLIGPYVNAGVDCLFEDIDFGQFLGTPTNVLYKGTGHPRRAVLRREETMMKNYGVRHHLQNDEQFEKAWKSRFAQYREVHWKTGQSLLCTAKWELATVRWLNERKIDYLWQPRAFKMPNGRTYRPDAYIVDWNLWIDVKGYFPESSRVKCDWFKSIMPNFEVWMKDKLYELGILT